jgi:gluconolactonase
MFRRLHYASPLFAMIGLATGVFGADPIPEIGPVGEVKKVHGELQFTEGPTWDGKGSLYFTDIPADRIYKTDGKKLETFAEPAGHCNGLMIAGSTLYACSMDGALVAFDLKSGEKTVLAGEHEGTRFNAPNDLVIDQAGGVYFTDPRFRAPEPWPQKVEAVYYRAADGTVSRVVDELNQKAPNGVILSPDEKTLYVVCSMQDEVMAYPVEAPGELGQGKVFTRLKQAEGKTEGGGDGLTLDAKGNLYITSALGVQVFSPQGRLLGVVALPEQPANVTFGGPDRKTLYATARTSLYAVPMEAQGHAFPGKGE